MKIRDAFGVSVILHGFLILFAVLSLNFSSSKAALNASGTESYSIDYITISAGSSSKASYVKAKTKSSLKTLTTPNNKSLQSKLKYYDKSKKTVKKNTVVNDQTKIKKISNIAAFKRKDNFKVIDNVKSQTDGVRIGISSGGTSLGDGNKGVSDPVFSGYFFRFKNKISRYWHKIPSPNKQEKKVTIIKFKIFRNGSVDDILVESSSGDSFNDRAALRAIKSASPFERLPYQYNLNYLLIHFEFIWE